MNIEKLYKTVVDLIDEVPFGNSDWQNRNVIVNEEMTPARAFRHASLRIMNRIEALRELKYNMRKRDIEIRILQRDMKDERDELKRELLALEIERMTSGGEYTEKLTKDALCEIESLWPVLQSMGKITRAQFEGEEIEHFRRKIGRESKNDGDLFNLIESGKLGATRERLPDLRALLADTSEEET